MRARWMALAIEAVRKAPAARAGRKPLAAAGRVAERWMALAIEAVRKAPAARAGRKPVAAAGRAVAEPELGACPGTSKFAAC